MNPRESTLLLAAAQLLARNQDTAYGLAHAVRDALQIQEEIERQTTYAYQSGLSAEEVFEALRKEGAL